MPSGYGVDADLRTMCNGESLEGLNVPNQMADEMIIRTEAQSLPRSGKISAVRVPVPKPSKIKGSSNIIPVVRSRPVSPYFREDLGHHHA